MGAQGGASPLRGTPTLPAFGAREIYTVHILLEVGETVYWAAVVLPNIASDVEFGTGSYTKLIPLFKASLRFQIYI